MREWPEDLRPRLSDAVRVRLDRSAADFGDARIVLHTDDGELAVIDGRAWRLLSCCDGTRDVTGIRLAAEARGTRTSLEQVSAFLGRLWKAGCLEDGVLRPPDDTASSSAPDRPVEPLPDFAFECDGRGSCCRFFATMTFRPDEVLRARVLAPEVADAGAHPWQGFSPVCGSSDTPWRASAVATVTGRCGYLDDNGGCGLHRRGGEGAKPLGCRIFPAVVVDTGEVLRVGPRPECACVLRSGRVARAAAPLLSTPLDPGVVVTRLPEQVVVEDETWSRRRYLEWSEASETERGTMEPLAWLEHEARRMGCEPERARDTLDEQLSNIPPDESLFGRVLRAIGEERPASADEAFYLRAVAFMHLWTLDARPLGEALARRAAVLRLGRRIALFDDPAGEAPLALAEALARRLGFIGH